MRMLALLITMALLGGCDDDAERRRHIVAEQDAELLRLSDPAHGSDEIRKRVLENLKLSNPYVAIWVHSMYARVIPVATPWTVRCDDMSGLSIAFKTDLTELWDGLEMRLSEARPSKDVRSDIVMSTAKVLDADPC